MPSYSFFFKDFFYSSFGFEALSLVAYHLSSKTIFFEIVLKTLNKSIF
jgi:hypothetical protein